MNKIQFVTQSKNELTAVLGPGNLYTV